MKILKLIVVIGVLGLFSSAAWADNSDAEATIRLMNNAEAELPDAVTREITLPAHLLGVAAEDRVATVEKAEKGHEKANERTEHRGAGQEQAEDARERGAEMKENAKENRENRGRSDDHPSPPKDPPGRN
jgi:peroxiredoxin